MQNMPWRKKPRSAQQLAFDALVAHPNSLNVKIPTGYGKTFICAGIFSILQKQGKVNRLLVIFPTDYQLEQFYNDGHKEFYDAVTEGPLKVIDIRFSRLKAIKEHRSNTAQIFAITVQALRERSGFDLCTQLMETGQWMICVDEYHHYGIDKAWSKAVLRLSRVFLLTMSATPWRPNDDNAFGPPDLSMSYVGAQKECSVKPLRGHAYNYRIDVLLDDGTEESYTTADFIGMVGTDDPERIEKFRIERKMRWSPKYISPLVLIPVERMLSERIATGYRLQALIGAMCVSHAEFVCEQIKALFPDLRVDWVGTGEHGRSSDKNKEILKQFCPPKDDYGNRATPELDALVHVGMAGEGLDTISVSEIVFLNNASVCNKKIQEAGRGARFLTGVTGNINFDASCDFAAQKYVGAAFMNVMDAEPPSIEEPEPEPPHEVPLLPEDPNVRINNMELIEIDSGDPGVQRMAKVASDLGLGTVDHTSLAADPNHAGWEDVIKLYRQYQSREAAQFNEKSTINQWRDNVENAVRLLARRVIRMIAKNGQAMDNTIAGRIKTSINRRKKMLLGEVQNDLELLKRHYAWCLQLEKELINQGIPKWLEL